jgi:predicted DNA-binding protein
MTMKSLNGSGKTGRAVRLEARVPDPLHTRLELAAERRGISVSAIVREAIERYLDALDGADEPFDLMKAVRSGYVQQ